MSKKRKLRSSYDSRRICSSPVEVNFSKRIYGNAYCITDIESRTSTTKNVISLLPQSTKPPNVVGW